MKGDKEHLPMSLRVKDAAEALLMCITDQVVSYSLSDLALRSFSFALGGKECHNESLSYFSYADMHYFALWQIT